MLSKTVRYHHKMRATHDRANQSRCERETNSLEKLLKEQVSTGNLGEPYEQKSIGGDMVYPIKNEDGQKAIQQWIASAEFKGIVGICNY